MTAPISEIDAQIAELQRQRKELLDASRASVIVSVRMTSDAVTALDERAAFYGVTRSDMVRAILAREIRLPMVKVSNP